MVCMTVGPQVCCITECVCVCFCILADPVHFLKDDSADSALSLLLEEQGLHTACEVQGNSASAFCLGTSLWKSPSLQGLLLHTSQEVRPLREKQPKHSIRFYNADPLEPCLLSPVQ